MPTRSVPTKSDAWPRPVPSRKAALAVPSQDLVLGGYYLTLSRKGAKGEGKVFADFESVLLAYHSGDVETHTPVRVRYTGRYVNLDTQRTSESAHLVVVGQHDHRGDRRRRGSDLHGVEGERGGQRLARLAPQCGKP